MSQPKRVSFLSTGHLADRHRQVLASLPGYWTATDAGAADAVYVDSDLAAAEAAVVRGAKYVMIGDPAAVRDGDVKSLQQNATVVVASEIVPRLWADGSSVAAEWSLIEATTSVGHEEHLASALLEQLLALRALSSCVGHAVPLTVGDGGYVVRAETNSGGVALLTGLATRSSRREMCLNAISSDQRVAIELDVHPIASPARITKWTRAGMSHATPVNQSGLRILWEDLASSRPRANALALDIVLADIATTRRLLVGRRP